MAVSTMRGMVINNCAVFFTDTTLEGTFVGANWIQWGASATTVYALESGATPVYSSTLTLASGTVTIAEKVGGKFSTVYPFPFNMQYTYAGGLLYSGTGVVYDPTTEMLAGTLQYNGTNLNSTNLGYYAQILGVSTVNATSGRVFVAVSTISSPLGVFGPPGINIFSYDTSTYTLVTASTYVGVSGPAVELLQLSPTSFAILSPTGQISLVSSPLFGL